MLKNCRQTQGNLGLFHETLFALVKVVHTNEEGFIKGRNDLHKHDMFLPNNYSFVSILCEGGSGTLMICENTETNQQYVAKLLSFENPRSKQSFKNEVELLEELKDCTNIINIVEHESHTTYGCIILPKMKCDLMDLLEPVEKFEESVTKGIFYQICLAVKACHDHDIAHLDIKPENILQSYEGNFYLADFGGARKIYDPNYEVENIMITRAYSAPELRDVGSLQIHPLAADIWSLGIVLFSLLTGAWPFTNIDSLTPDTPVTFILPSLRKLKIYCRTSSNVIQQPDPTSIKYLRILGLFQQPKPVEVEERLSYKNWTSKIHLILCLPE